MKLSINKEQAIELGLCNRDQIWYAGEAFEVNSFQNLRMSSLMVILTLVN